MEKKELFSLANKFSLEGEIKEIIPFGEGHINSTFLIITSKNKYILQRINDHVFPDVDGLMNNINIVTSFISSKGKEAMKVIPSKKNELYIKTRDGYFRVLEFVKDTVCYQKVGSNLEIVRSEGIAFGELHQLLSDLDPNIIKEVIPDFHNTEKRYKDFVNAKETAPIDKKIAAKAEIDFIDKQKETYSLINKEIKKGNVKTRIIHNDTKINNVLFDEKSGLYRCVIDLDTMMPGSILYDVGDALRSLFTGDNEDNKNTALLKVNYPLYIFFMSGYLSKMKNELSEKEIELLPYSVYLMTIEVAMRFLEDYLRGNKYFAVKYEDHNLVRARTQIALAKDILFNLKHLQDIVGDIIRQ